MKNDKLLHFLVGGSIGLLTLPLAFAATFMWSVVLTFVLGSIVFIGKEYYDTIKQNPTGFDKIDLASDYFGWAGGVILSFFVYGIIQIIML